MDAAPNPAALEAWGVRLAGSLDGSRGPGEEPGIAVTVAVRELRRCVEELGFKGLRVVPWLWEAPPTDRRYDPLYVACVFIDASVYTPRRFPPELVAYMGGRGRRNKVLFGTSYAMVGHSQALEGLDALCLDAEAHELFLHRNAERILNLPALRRR